MSSVQIRDVRKSFGNFEVLHGVSIPIDDGEFVVLVGPSGCGKSTLLRMLAGLENITSGTISIGDRVVNNVQPKERDIAMVFQNYALYPHMTVAENMGFALKIAKWSAPDIRQRVEEAAQLLMEAPPKAQRQRRARQRPDGHQLPVRRARRRGLASAAGGWARDRFAALVTEGRRDRLRGHRGAGGQLHTALARLAFGRRPAMHHREPGHLPRRPVDLRHAERPRL